MKFAKKISPETIRKLAELPTNWGPLGYVVYKRTYARMRPDLGRTEEWHETVERGCNGLLEIGGAFTEEQINQFAFNWHQLKGCPAGRPIWQLGTETVRKLGGNSLCNCWHVGINSLEAFTFAFNQLLLGGGVGFSVTPEVIFELPPVRFATTVERVDDFDCDFVVPDNREGWVELLRRTLDAFFVTGKPLRYDTRCIRPKGRPISGFGGVASGPEELVSGMATIASILTGAVGRKLRSVECTDILNIIGSIVVSGNVRRAAEIAVGDMFDRDFLAAKDWSRGKIPAYRQMSNNTVSCDDASRLPKAFWRGYDGNGEAYGLFNLPLSRSHGRLVDGVGHRPDAKCLGPNPCAEQILEPFEPCNLGEIFASNLTDESEFHEVATLLLRAAKAVTNLPYIDRQTEEVVRRNRRVGLSITGFQQAGPLRRAEVLDSVYRHLEGEDRAISKEMGINQSIKLTCVKPSGTLSLLAGVTPGVHAAFSQYYIRRVTFAATDPLVEVTRNHGYKVVPKINLDGSKDLHSLVAEFPCTVPPGTRVANDYDAISQLEDQRFLQTWWADGAVSATCYFKKGEVASIKEWLNANYRDSVKTTSFLLHQNHGFAQAPFEEISEAQYHKLSAKCRPITSLDDKEQQTLADSVECTSGSCPVR